MPSDRIGGISLYTPYKKWIKEIMEAKSEPIKKLEKEEKEIDEASSALKDITSKLYKLRFVASDLTLSSNFYEEKTQNSNPSVADVVVKNKRIQGDFSLEVKSLASPHKILSDALPVSKPAGVSGQIQIEVGGNSSTVSISENDNIDMIVSKFNATGIVKAYRIDRYIVLESKKTGSEGRIKISGEAARRLGFIESSFTQDVNLDKWSHTFSGKRNVRFSFQALSPGHYKVVADGRVVSSFTLTRDENGNFSPVVKTLNIRGVRDLAVESDTGEIGEVRVELPPTVKNEIAKPSNAVFILNGVRVERSSNEDIKDVIPGMVITLKGVGRTVISVQRTPTGGKDLLLDFVKTYNDLLKSIYDYENKYGSDLTLEMMRNRMRSIVLGRYQTEYGEAIFPMFGISTGKPGSSWDEVKFGFLYVDEKKLKKALEVDFQKFVQFLGYDKNGDGIKDTGMAVALKSYLDSVVGPRGLVKAKEEALSTRRKTIQDEIAMRKERLEREKERLESEFSKLERVMAEFEQQKQYISSFGIIKNGGGSSLFKNNEENENNK